MITDHGPSYNQTRFLHFLAHKKWAQACLPGEFSCWTYNTYCNRYDGDYDYPPEWLPAVYIGGV